MKKLIPKIVLLPVVFLLYGCECQMPDLKVTDLDVTWTNSEQYVSFKVQNAGPVDAGAFMVYVNLKENPVSSNHRPQLRERADGLPAGETLEYTELDLSHLSHPDNNLLGNVYEIIVEADPKHEIEECDTSNNTFTSAVSSIDVDCWLNTGFEALTPGTQYPISTTFNSDMIDFKTVQFLWSNGTPSPKGHAEVQNNQAAGGNGQDLWTNNMNVEFILPPEVHYISFNAGYYGGNMNLNINGCFHNFNDVGSINGMNLCGVSIISTGTNNTPGIWEFTGPITSFYVGGQEFCIDHVCIK